MIQPLFLVFNEGSATQAHFARQYVSEHFNLPLMMPDYFLGCRGVASINIIETDFNPLLEDIEEIESRRLGTFRPKPKTFKTSNRCAEPTALFLNAMAYSTDLNLQPQAGLQNPSRLRLSTRNS